MARSISDILKRSNLRGVLLVTGASDWIGMWLPLQGQLDSVRATRNSNSGDALARAATANR